MDTSLELSFLDGVFFCLFERVMENIFFCDFVCVVFDRVMYDEVSDIENIRKNFVIERMIVEGCDILLDIS